MRVLYLAMSPDGQVLNVLTLHSSIMCSWKEIIHFNYIGTIADNSNWSRGWDSPVLEYFPINESTCKQCDQFQLWPLVTQNLCPMIHDVVFFFQAPVKDTGLWSLGRTQIRWSVMGRQEEETKLSQYLVINYLYMKKT